MSQARPPDTPKRRQAITGRHGDHAPGFHGGHFVFTLSPKQQTTNPIKHMQTTTIQSASLHYREGNSDKVYQAAIEPKGDGYIVTFAYGRRGNTLTTGTKTDTPVPLATATKALRQARRLESSPRATQPDRRGQQTLSAIRRRGTRQRHPLPAPQPGRKSECRACSPAGRHCLQEKHDGRRLMVRKQGDEITGINRRGLVVAIPDPIREAVEHIPFDVLIDGEAVGDTLHAFDLLEVKGN